MKFFCFGIVALASFGRVDGSFLNSFQGPHLSGVELALEAAATHQLARAEERVSRLRDLQAKNDDLRAKKNELEHREAASKAEGSSEQRRLQKLQQEMTELRHHVVSAEAEKRSLLLKMRNLSNSSVTETLRKQIATANGTGANETQECAENQQRLQQSIEATKKQAEDWKFEAKQLQSQTSENSATEHQIQEHVDNLQRNVTSLQAEKQRVEDVVGVRIAEHSFSSDVHAHSAELRALVAQLQSELRSAQARVDGLQDDILSAQKRNAEAEQTLQESILLPRDDATADIITALKEERADLQHNATAGNPKFKQLREQVQSLEIDKEGLVTTLHAAMHEKAESEAQFRAKLVVQDGLLVDKQRMLAQFRGKNLTNSSAKSASTRRFIVDAAKPNSPRSAVFDPIFTMRSKAAMERYLISRTTAEAEDAISAATPSL